MAFLNPTCRRGGKFIGEAFTALLLMLAWLSSRHAGLATETGTYPEYQIKAAFLYNFTQFVEWPTNAFPTPDSPLIIGILGSDPFGNTLDDIVRGEKVNGHPLTVSRHHSIEELKAQACHILFISQSEKGQTEDILNELKGRSILTVGETEGFAKNGGMIRFITEKRKTRLRINAEAARNVQLNVSAKLLRLAEIVTTAKE